MCISMEECSRKREQLVQRSMPDMFHKEQRSHCDCSKVSRGRVIGDNEDPVL